MIIIFGIILLLVSLVNPFFGLINYMTILYLRPMEVYPQLAPYHIARVFAIAVIISFLIQKIGAKKWFFNNKQDVLFLGLLLAIGLSFFAGWIPQCLLTFEQMVKNVIVYILIIGLIASEKRLKILLWSLLIMSGVIGYNTFQEYMSLNVLAQRYFRIGGFSGGYFGGAGDLAAMLNTVIPFGFFLGISSRPIVLRPIALFLTLACIAGMISTLSRGAGVITFGAIILAVSFFGLQRKGILKKIINISLVVACLIGVLVLAPSAVKDRAVTIADYQSQATATSRIEFWKLGIKMFFHSPLIGIGAGNYPLQYKNFGGWENQWRVSHNMYIEVLSELGAIGFFFFFLLIFTTFKDGFHINKILKQRGKANSFIYAVNQGSIVSLLAYCVAGLFQSIFTYPILYMIIGVNVAIKNMAMEMVNKSSV